MRCLDKWKAYGNTYNLVQINDFSVIPSSIISATTYAEEPEVIYRGSSLPNYVTSIGDKFDSFDSATTGARYFAASEYLDVAVGKYTYNGISPVMIGTFCRELVYQNKQFGQTGWSNIGNIIGDVYYGVVIDDTNSRAYLIEVRYVTNHPTYGNVWYIFMSGGKANGVDVIYKTFQPTYTSNGGGATHIAKVTGQLKDLSSNLSDILMVSGGGGGGLLLGDSGWHGTEQNIAWSGNNNKLTVQLDDDDVLFKMYIGSSNIYSFTAPVSDISNIYLQFLIDSENEVAKPSFVYKNGSSYSFNQEEPTDSEMGDIYTWLSAGLPSE